MQCLLDRWNFPVLPIPTDRPHLAAFILPSSVAGSQGPTSKPTDSRYSRRSSHCGESSNSARPNTSDGGPICYERAAATWQLTCEAPHCWRAFAIAIVTRRAETPVGWLG